MEIPTNLSISLSEFEDPINLEPLSDVIRCPHHPSHHYQVGTLPKRTQKGIEYTQCSLTNEWFVSSQFTRDDFATRAMHKIREINETNRQTSEEKERLNIKVKSLEKEIFDLTDHYKDEISSRDKTIEEWKKLFITQQEEFRVEKEKDILDLKNKFELMINEDREAISKLQKIIELQAATEKETTARLLSLVEKKQNDSIDTWTNHIFKISFSLLTSGIIALACKKIYSKVMDTL